MTVLRGVSLQIHPGEFVAIVGPSGNGKSTLLNMITGIDHPTTGEVFVNERAVHRMNENQLAAWRNTDVGIVFQFFQLLPSLNLRAEHHAADGFRASGSSRRTAASRPCACWNWWG